MDSPFTGAVGSIADRDFVRQAVRGVDAVVHSATLHKPHVESHGRQEFVDTNIAGTLNLLEESVAAGVGRFIFISTTSAFGRALVPAEGEPAAWITEDVQPVPRNIYGTTKKAAEDLCQLIAQDDGLPVLVLRTSRFFPELDDTEEVRTAYPNLNLKVNELLHRRVDIADIVDAVELALDRAPSIGFGRYIVTATSPFGPDDRRGVRDDLPAVVRRLYPSYEEIYAGARLEDVPVDRPDLRERAGAARARLEAAVGVRICARAAGCRGGPAERARDRDRREGLPRRVDRRLHRPLSAAASRLRVLLTEPGRLRCVSGLR